MFTELFEFTGTGGMMLPAMLWLPEDTPRLVVQITHGMTEHIARYDALARALTARRIAVAGFDLRGHGRNPGDPEVASLGEGGWEATIGDMRCFFGALKARFPGMPHAMLGFSLGSVLLREYIERYPQDADGAVVVGTACQPGAVLSVIRAIVKREIGRSGYDSSTPLIRKLSFETYNGRFAPNRTKADWLMADEAQLDMFLADPLARAQISAGLFYALLGGIKACGARREGSSWRKDMPVLLLSGQDDPVSDFGRAVKTVARRMEASGMQRVTQRILPGARHDVLHEEACGAAQEARRLIADWLMESVCP